MSKVCKDLEGIVMYLKVYICILKHKNVFLMVNRCILKDTKVFEFFFNAFGCIYSVLHCIGSIFQCNSMHL
jgi:hypothetical protein